MNNQAVGAALRWMIALFYAAAGVLHIMTPAPFVLIVPDWVPFKIHVVIGTGICEIAGAFGLLNASTRKYDGCALALYAICVFPANIKHALYDIAVPGLPSSWWYHGPRLLLQPVLVWLTLYAVDIRLWPCQTSDKLDDGPHSGQA